MAVRYPQGLLRIETVSWHGVPRKYGVVETRCYPAAFYAGPLNEWHGQLSPASNETVRFHRDMDAADRALTEELKEMKRR